jgi:hypothetical protein
MRFHVTSKSYCVSLTNEQWRDIYFESSLTGTIASLVFIERLEKAGCSRIDWNGHFGRNLFYTCAVEDTKTARAAVTKEFRRLKRNRLRRKSSKAA